MPGMHSTASNVQRVSETRNSSTQKEQRKKVCEININLYSGKTDFLSDFHDLRKVCYKIATGREDLYGSEKSIVEGRTRRAKEY